MASNNHLLPVTYNNYSNDFFVIAGVNGLAGIPASIHNKNISIDVRGILAGQKQGYGCNLLGGSGLGAASRIFNAVFLVREIMAALEAL